MSNVVQLGEYRKSNTPVAVPQPSTSESFAAMVIDWAEANGVDIAGDMGFKIRLADFIAHLKVSAKKASA